jgi:hypothetical protein
MKRFCESNVATNDFRLLREITKTRNCHENLQKRRVRTHQMAIARNLRFKIENIFCLRHESNLSGEFTKTATGETEKMFERKMEEF